MTFLKNGRTDDMTAAAQKHDKASHAMLDTMRAEADSCFDCTATRPGWAVLPHGVFICMECAQIHRHLGRHVSQTKAINTRTYLWFKEELAVMASVGNYRAHAAFASCDLPPKPSRDAPSAEKMAYARLKYITSKPDWSLVATTWPSSSTATLTSSAQAAHAATTKPALLSHPRVTTALPAPPRPASPDLINFEAALCAPPRPNVHQSSNQFFADFGL